MDVLKTLKVFIILGENMEEKERLAYESRIIFATMKHFLPEFKEPDNWDKKIDSEKRERLDMCKQILFEDVQANIKKEN
tara:strand:- start:19 stop:255 length:237 start_codon:yes stop_codon:yes gene_type:complete